MENNFVLTADIGGTHITSAIVNIKTWQILEESISRSHVNARSDAKSIFLSWKDCLNSSLANVQQPIATLGIAMPGPFNYEAGISLMQNQDKYDALYKINVLEELKKTLDLPIAIRFINDAAAFLQGEIFAGDLTLKGKVLGITLGTGLGSAVWEKGNKAYDANLWNSPYKDGIFEEHLVTRWLTTRFFALTGIQENGFKEILAKHQGKPSFDQLLSEYASSLYDFLLFFSEQQQCRIFVLGGSISKAWEIISSYNKEKFKDFEIFIGQYAEQAAMIGAASLFKP